MSVLSKSKDEVWGFIPTKSLLSFSLVTMLFLIWGIPNNMNDILIKQFMKSFELSRTQAGLIQSAFYMGYFFLAVPSGLIMKKYSYKVGLIAGLLLFALGCYLFWPAAVAGKYGLFLFALFVIASGLTFLETGTNIFIVELDNSQSAERRLNFSQAFNPIGKVKAIGVGAKDWRSIARVYDDVDWVMIANSMTIKSHPKSLLDFMKKLEDDGVQIINSAVFHSGYLIRGDYFDYRLITADEPQHKALVKWREDFFKLCTKFNIKPAEACVQFALMAPGVKSIALSTTNSKRVKDNIAMGGVSVPKVFWKEMINNELIDRNCLEYTNIL